MENNIEETRRKLKTILKQKYKNSSVNLIVEDHGSYLEIGKFLVENAEGESIELAEYYFYNELELDSDDYDIIVSLTGAITTIEKKTLLHKLLRMVKSRDIQERFISRYSSECEEEEVVLLTINGITHKFFYDFDEGGNLTEVLYAKE